MVEVRKGNPIHRLTIAAIAASLRSMAQIMNKAESHAAKNNIDLNAYLQARLYPDMYNLLQQLQYVCYLSVDLARHFSDAPAPRVGYDETTWPELRKSVDTAAATFRQFRLPLCGSRPGELCRFSTMTPRA